MAKKEQKGNWLSNWIYEMHKLQIDMTDLATMQKSEGTFVTNKPPFWKKYGLEIGYNLFFLISGIICWFLVSPNIARILFFMVGIQLAVRLWTLLIKLWRIIKLKVFNK